ncbi:MAG: hypothetical protein L3J35_08955 [Bacteroidales bacterium]|nr:hypothetical protein [Bacteroidales bacterium]
MKTIKNIAFLFLITLSASCYTYNIPSGATIPLITEEGEAKLSAYGNFNEIGGSFTYALTEHVLFSASGNYILDNADYIQDYDSMFLKKTPNNFEVAFGYFGNYKQLANHISFGVGTGNMAYQHGKTNDYLSGYFQTEYVQYFLQYTAGFKYQKGGQTKKYREQGLSLRYGYHNYHVLGISKEYSYTEVWNDAGEYYDYIDVWKDISIEETSFFNSFSAYYFFRTGNEKIQFEVSPGFSFYDNKPNYYNYSFFTSALHFNVGMVFNLNQFKKNKAL